jgi:hypothetical protein
MIANFAIDRPALLENNRKIATMGGARLSLCQKNGLSLFVICLFLWVFKELRKVSSPAPKKKL